VAVGIVLYNRSAVVVVGFVAVFVGIVLLIQ
jgi:hypothetical protein